MWWGWVGWWCVGMGGGGVDGVGVGGGGIVGCGGEKNIFF